MHIHDAEAMAYARPGGEIPVPSRARPVDLVHLARQTLGDRALEAEVLGLFLHQAKQVREEIVTAQPPHRKRLAHGLKGAALGIGAFGVADCAAEIEARPDDAALLRKLARRVEEVRDFVAAISR
jgi:hypothetical protein